nr:hypothetical protein [Tanacetum cinerariifolium]
MATQNINKQPLCIQYPPLTVPFGLKSGLIHLLPTFCNLAGEDPYKHLRNFMCFPIFIGDKAKDWLYYLPFGSITTWDEMKQQFLEKFFPASRAANIRNDMCNSPIQWRNVITDWERFSNLVLAVLNVRLRTSFLFGKLEYDPKIEKTAKTRRKHGGKNFMGMATQNINKQPLCIQYPPLTVPFGLKSGLIHLLPTFCNLAGEDPYKHLRNFMCFPIFIGDKAKDWLYYLPFGSITTWDEMKQQFLEKFFPASRAANIRNDMCNSPIQW